MSASFYRIFICSKYAKSRFVRGLSTVISTVILTFTLLIIVLSTSAFVTEVFSFQQENAEFKQAKYVMLTLASSINDVAYTPYSSNYVKTGFKSAMPQLVDTGGTIQIFVNDNSIATIPIRKIVIQGGRRVDASEENLVGVDDLLVADISTPLSRVYVNRNDRAEVVLDYSRVRCVYLGTLTFYDSNQTYNIVEIVAVNLSFGTIRAYKEAVFSVQNTGITVSQIQASGNFTIHVVSPNREEEVSLTGLGGNATYPTLVNLQLINIQVSLLGGG